VQPKAISALKIQGTWDNLKSWCPKHPVYALTLPTDSVMV